MKNVTYLLLSLTLIYSCANNQLKKDSDESEYLSEKEYNTQFDTITHNFFFERYKVYEDIISRCAVERELSKVLETKLKTLMWRQGRVLFNSLDTASKTRYLIMMDSKSYFFHARAFNNDYTSTIKAWDSVKIHGEMIGFLYDKNNEDLDPLFVAVLDSIKIMERSKQKTNEK